MSSCCVVFSSTENDTALRTVLGRVLFVVGSSGGPPGGRGGSLLGEGEARMEAGGIVSARAQQLQEGERAPELMSLGLRCLFLSVLLLVVLVVLLVLQQCWRCSAVQ